MNQINNRQINKTIINDLIKHIKKKKELGALPDSFILERLNTILKKEPKLSFKLSSKQEHLTSRSKDCKKIIKLVRNELRRDYGLFRLKSKDKLSLLVKDLVNNPGNQLILAKILQLHSSTKERLPYYEQLYQQLFAITGKPLAILDLGCGLNPFSIPFMNLKALTYYAYDLSESELKAIRQFFKIIKLKGQAEILDITKTNKFPSVDTAFLFKMTEILDQGRGHKRTEEVLKQIPARYVVISFATRTMSRRPMNAPRRRWVEWLCRRLGYAYTVLELPNELFYMIKKEGYTKNTK